ncbi:hypothetical protein L1049_004073 [Liquidambar formosana]|uniref:Uncharacterized protein n=1 Tax=Liquidambar formosana TaxID=63359 RepID=A0AAP0RNH2_LIQFO
METMSSREARRRRVVEGGSDRLASITGRVQTLPSSSSSSFQHEESSPPLFSSDHLPDQIHVGSEGEDDASGSTLLKNDTSNESSSKNAFDFGNQVEPQLHKCEMNTEATQAPALEVRNKILPSPVTSIIEQTSIATEMLSKPHGHHPKFFTPKQISSCILASESTRSFCSFMIALLVVLSYSDYQLLGRNLVNSESVITSKPLYILLLTDLTIVLSLLLLERRKGFEKEKEEERTIPQKDGHNWAEAVKVLETGLVIYQTICAVFMDFCIYAVVVICGLSFV